MLKRLEMADPKSCWNKAAEDEMVFVLLARDKAAPATIRFWVQERARLGLNKGNYKQLSDALDTADEMEKANGGDSATET